jgi:hypothetical protein
MKIDFFSDKKIFKIKPTHLDKSMLFLLKYIKISFSMISADNLKFKKKT